MLTEDGTSARASSSLGMEDRMATLPKQPQVDEQSWLESVCRRFSVATGWPLKYQAVEQESASEVTARLTASDHCSWFQEIHDGERCSGLLYLDLPADSQNDHTFLTAVELAETVGQILSRLAVSTRKLAARTEEISTLVGIGRAVSREDDLKLALDQLLKATVQLTGFRASGFFLLDPAANCLNLRIAHSVLDQIRVPRYRRDLRQGPPDLEAMAQGTVVLRRTATPGADEWLPQECATGVCVAVQSESGPVGTLWAYDRRARIPGDRELHVLESLAAQIATVLERVVLLRESQSQHRLQRELRVIGESQSGEKLCSLPKEALFEVAGRCRSRWELGGDLCELISLDAHRTLVAVGDASGDGIPAAMVMTAVRAALRAIVSEAENEPQGTDAVVRRINQTLVHIAAAHQFMSLFYGVLDTEKMAFTYTNAGHPNPLLIRQDESTLLKSHGMLLGVTESADYGSSTESLQAGDLLVLFSDGIVEAMNRERKMFRNDGILEAIQGVSRADAADVLEAIWNRAEAHATGGSGQDDRTLLVIRLRDAAARQAVFSSG